MKKQEVKTVLKTVASDQLQEDVEKELCGAKNCCQEEKQQQVTVLNSKLQEKTK